MYIIYGIQHGESLRSLSVTIYRLISSPTTFTSVRVVVIYEVPMVSGIITFVEVTVRSVPGAQVSFTPYN